jgi:type II secretory pathway pseudopilin PulG
MTAPAIPQAARSSGGPAPTPPAGRALRSGITLFEVLAVIAMVIILALLLMPVFGKGYDNSRQTVCAKNQSQIMGACVAYAQQEATAWPEPWVNTIGYAARGQPIAVGVAAMNYTFGCFEVLANEATLPNGMFRCPVCESPGPNTRPQPGAANPELSGSNWADAGGGSRKRIGYAFDWAAPGDPDAVRIVFSDRDLTNHRRKGVMACFGDSHTRFLKVFSGPHLGAPNETIGMHGSEVVVGDVIIPADMGALGAVPGNQVPDNIFNSAGDVPAGKTAAQTVLTPGGGGTSRVFVK